MVLGAIADDALLGAAPQDTLPYGALVASHERADLAIQGYDDEYGTMAQLDEIARRVPGPCELLKLERCGHAPFRDQPEQTLSALTRFIDS